MDTPTQRKCLLKPEATIRDLNDRETMFRLWQERGAMTEEQLVRAGISKDSQARNAPAVAERIRLLEPMAA